MSLYGAAGGLIGAETLGVEIDRRAHEREPGFVAELWAAFAPQANRSSAHVYKNR